MTNCWHAAALGGSERRAKGWVPPRDLFDSAVAIEKLLDCAKRCLMQFLRTPQQAEVHSKFSVQRFGIVADNLKTTALRGTLWSESADDHVASALYRAGDLADIGNTVSRRGKEMEDSAVMPNIVSRGLQFNFSDIGDEPVDALRGLPQSFPVRVDGGLRNIEDRDVLVSPSTSVDSPPPTSMTEAEILADACSIKASEVLRCGRYQLTASGAFSV